MKRLVTVAAVVAVLAAGTAAAAAYLGYLIGQRSDQDPRFSLGSPMWDARA